MIIADIVRAGLIASVPTLALFSMLPIWWIYLMGFLNSTVSILFDSCEFAAITSLVKQDDLVTANGRIEASYSAASIMGPLLAGALVAVIPIYDVMFADAASFLVSSFSLALVSVSFNLKREKKTTSIRADMVEGLRYVISHPVLRNISMMMALVNFVSSTVWAQFVLFAKQQLSANDLQWGLLSSAGSIGVIVLSLSAGPLRKRFPFSKVALSSLALEGLVIFALSFVREYWVAVPLWALSSGLGILFNINTSSLRQAIVPNDMLGRVRSIAGVLAWSAIPLGTFIGGIIIQTTGNIALVYTVIGLLNAAIPIAFSFTALGHAERYLPQNLPDADKLAAQEAEKAIKPGAAVLEAADAGQRLGEPAAAVVETGSR
jgi:Transmembrane secretion effector